MVAGVLVGDEYTFALCTFAEGCKTGGPLKLGFALATLGSSATRELSTLMSPTPAAASEPALPVGKELIQGDNWLSNPSEYKRFKAWLEAATGHWAVPRRPEGRGAATGGDAATRGRGRRPPREGRRRRARGVATEAAATALIQKSTTIMA